MGSGLVQQRAEGSRPRGQQSELLSRASAVARHLILDGVIGRCVAAWRLVTSACTGCYSMGTGTLL